VKNKLDVSWKDFLAGILGYFAAMFLVWGIYLGIGIMVGKTGDETLWSRYEFVISCVTFLAFFVGGVVMGAIRPATATRNAAILLIVVLLMGAWHMSDEIVSVIDVALVALQVSGLMLGAWFVQHRHVQKKKIV
jgi:uncharacterized protein YybS (DUF2232 family)